MIILFSISAICNLNPEQSEQSISISDGDLPEDTSSQESLSSVQESQETEIDASVSIAPEVEDTFSSGTAETTAPEIMSLTVPRVDSESGYLIRGEEPYKTWMNIFYIGDSGQNNPSRSFISFDISALSGVTVTSAQFSADPYESGGDASGLFPIGIFVADWGPVSIYTCSFDQAGTSVGTCSSQDIVFSSEALRNELAAKIASGSPRFQLMIYFTGAETNGNNQWDGYSYGVPSADLTIEYTD